MRSLVLPALVALAALPLSAHEHWRGPHHVVVVEESRYAPDQRWEDRRWVRERWERQGYDHRYDHRYDRRYDCDDDRVILRPLPLSGSLAPPFLGRVELRIR